MNRAVHGRSVAARWGSCVLLVLCGGLVALYVASYLRLPFADCDTLLYTMIGHALVVDRVLPYGAVFDHKPIGLYAIYGGWRVLDPLHNGAFTLFALLSIALIAGLAQLRGQRGWAVGLALLLFGAPFAILAGNSELAFLPLVFGAVVLAERGSPRACLGAGILAGLAIEVNYLAAPCVLPPLAWAVVTARRGRRSSRILLCLAGGIAGIAAPLLPFVGHQPELTRYFTLEWRYLHHYAPSHAGRMQATLRLLAYLACCLPLFLAERARPGRWTGRFWGAGATLAVLASGYPFPHYVLLVLLPAVLAWLPTRAEGWNRTRCFALLPLAALSLFGIAHDIRHNHFEARRLAALDTEKLRRVVGLTPVLGVEVTPVPFALAGIRPEGHFLFPGHVARLYGAQADRYYLDALSRAPRFVMTPAGDCVAETGMARFCAALARTALLSFCTPGEYGYCLYRLP